MFWRDVPCPISPSHPVGREVATEKRNLDPLARRLVVFDVWQALVVFQLGGEVSFLGRGDSSEPGILPQENFAMQRLWPRDSSSVGRQTSRENGDRVRSIWWFPNIGVPQKGMVYDGKSHLQMDDCLGCLHLWKPSCGKNPSWTSVSYVPSAFPPGFYISRIMMWNYCPS